MSPEVIRCIMVNPVTSGHCAPFPTFWGQKFNQNVLMCDSLSDNAGVVWHLMRRGGGVLLHEWLHWDVVFEGFKWPNVDWNLVGRRM